MYGVKREREGTKKIERIVVSRSQNFLSRINEYKLLAFLVTIR